MTKYFTERELQRNSLLKDGDYKSIKDMLCRINALIPQARVLAELDENKNIVYITAAELFEEVNALADGMIATGLEGKHIAIIADNSCRYVITDIAVASGTGVVTPVDKDAPDALTAKLLNTCDADAVFCSASLVEKIEKIKGEVPSLKTVITIDKKVEGCKFYDELLEEGRRKKNKGAWLAKPVDSNALSKILFTSGTTGPNKGVMLSDANLTANMINCLDMIRIEKGVVNTSMSVLPMHHATEINTHIMARIGCGRLTYINESMKKMMENIKIFKPHVITIVPMIANMFYRQIWAGAKRSGMDAKLKKGIRLAALAKKFGFDITHKLFDKVFEPFGGNLCQIVCGGSMLNPTVVKGMSDLGIYIVNGYGITECGPLVSMNAETYKEWKSVGYAAPGLEVRIDKPDSDGVGELCVRGKSVSLGYYKDPESTAKVFDKDGFFHTGDSARMDSSGRLFLSGRKKNVIVLSNGKNVCPEEVENAVENELDYVNDVVVYPASLGNQSVICAGIWIKDDEIRKDCNRVVEDLRRVNDQLPDYKRIEFVQFADHEYEKTSTRKIKRDKLPSECDLKKGMTV